MKRVIRTAVVATLSLSVLALLQPGAARADQPAKGKPESLDEILNQAASAAEAPKPEPAPAPAKEAPAKEIKVAAAARAPSKPAAPATPAGPPPPPPTDDNDGTGEAPAPGQLTAVAPSSTPRRRGNYQLGPLDCRVLDGAGIERLLPKKVVAGEEPDVLCRIVVTQPGDVLSEEHNVSLAVLVGGKQTHKETRKVRISSIGRRAMVFVIPAERIASEETALVTLQALLSQPATPAAGQSVKFTVETED